MSALGQKQTFAVQKIMSALPLKADMCGATTDVRFGPIADMCGATRDVRYGPKADIGQRFKLSRSFVWELTSRITNDNCVMVFTENDIPKRALPLSEALMGVNAVAPVALVVEDDDMQREMMVTLLEESEMSVIQCENAEAAVSVLRKMGAHVAVMLTDVSLAGQVDGVQLAHFAHQNYPNIHVIVTSADALTKKLPEGVTFMPKPWVALELLRHAVR